MFEFLQPTPEQLAEIKEMRKMVEIRDEEFRHASQRLMMELDEDQLSTLRDMLSAGIAQPGLLLTWEGMVSMALKMRFNVCVTCGINHDREIGDEDQAPESRSEPVSGFYQQPDEVVSNEPTPVDTPFPLFYELSDADKELMQQYHLDDLRVEESNELVGFICTGIEGTRGGCGMIYKSIEDRMLKDSEECSGCFRKAAQG